jgi:predicted nucleotide-binding protein (sugar kinase/HSP70/actin superfamily)
VLIAGEIYVRNVEFSNGGLADALAERGIATHVATISEYLLYSNHNGLHNRGYRWKDRLKTYVQTRIEALCHAAAAKPMGWAPATPVEEVLEAAGPYLHDRLEGEAILTIGTPVHEHRTRHIDAVVAVGPLECMPNKIAEAQLHHAGEREGLLSLALSVNGDPVPAEVLDSFAFEVHSRFRAKGGGAQA